MDSLFYIDTEPHKNSPKDSAWSDPDDETQTFATSSYHFGSKHAINNVQPHFKTNSEPTVIKCPVTPLKLFSLPEGLLIIGPNQVFEYSSSKSSFESYNRLNKPSLLLSSIYLSETAVLISKKSVTVRNLHHLNSKIDIPIREIKSGEIFGDRIALMKMNGVISIYSLQNGEELFCLRLNSPITFFKCDTNRQSIFGSTKHSIFSFDLRSLTIRETKLKEGTQTSAFCLTKNKAVVGYSSGCISIHSLLDFDASIDVNILKVPVDTLIGDKCCDNFLIWNIKKKGSFRVVSEDGKVSQVAALKFKNVSSAVILKEDKFVIGTKKCELIWHCIN